MRTFLAGLCTTLLVLSANPTLALAANEKLVEVRLLNGQEVKGTFTTLDAKELTLATSTGELKLSLEQVLEVKFVPATSEEGPKYALIELTDGTQLRAGKLSMQNKSLTVHLVGAEQDAPVKLDVNLVRYILNDAGNATVSKQWRETVLAKKWARDLLVVAKEGQLNALEGTLGAASEDGTKITFTLPSADGTAGTTVQPALERAQGLFYFRGPLTNAAPYICKVYDLAGNVLMAAVLEQKDARLTVTTTIGTKVDLALTRLSKLDYSKGKELFLSDLKPTRELLNCPEEYKHVYKPRLDKNMDGSGKIQLGGQVFNKGLALHSSTELEFEIPAEGEYREFKATLGFDPKVSGAPGAITFIIKGDGQELKKVELDRAKNTDPIPLVINVQNVSRLAIIVKSSRLLDAGHHLAIGEAKITK